VTAMENPLMRYAGKARRAALRFGDSIRLQIRKLLFSAIRWLDKDVVATASPAAISRSSGKTSLADASSLVKSAVVINSENAAMTPDVFDFYLSGVFPTLSYRERVRALLPRDVNGRSFVEMEELLGAAVADLAKSGAAEDSMMCQEFFSHKTMTALNRRAYVPKGRVNPDAVFWPDPTTPSLGRSLYTELPFAKRVPLINKQTRIVSAGSCFAAELAHSLQQNGYNYLVKEQNKGKPGSYEFLNVDVLPNSSAAWGIIFNTPSFRQLVEKAFGVRQLPHILWTQNIMGKLRYLDPFRENIGFDSPEAYEMNYEEHLRAARAAFEEMDVFVITLGLNEVWYFKADGSVFSRSPWRTAPPLVGHRILTAEENIADLVRMTEILRVHNPGVSIICTVSPIPLHATFRGDEEHVVTANAHSKAVLRVAAEEFARRCKNTYYFPSYEVVTTSTEHPWTEDQRHVTRDAVSNVMTLFHRMFDG
jgi:hypothetical protein